MKYSAHEATLLVASALLIASCACREGTAADFTPTSVIDLGAIVTDSLPQRFWGKAFLKQMSFAKQNSMEVIKWSFPVDGAHIPGSNAYYTLFNHGGPHVDAPMHVGAGPGIDSYRVESFSGPVKVFDVTGYSPGRSVPATVFEDRVGPGDIVLVFTKYQSPADDALPEVRTLTHEAAEYLATLPVRAYGTDAFSVEALTNTKMPWIHHSFLERGIPVYEQLLNVDKLLSKNRLYFVGPPLNMQGGDGMMVRPLVFVY